MAVRRLTQIFFSPTGTTRQILAAIAQGILPDDIRGYDLTPPENREHPEISLDDKDDLVLLGVPVYEEHVPEFLWECLNTLDGNGTPIVLVAVYGNIGYGMCLKELADWAKRAGFKVLGAAAFIGEHSFSHQALPLGKGRPDMEDLQTAKDFGRSIVMKLLAIGSDITNKVPGQLPLMARILPKDSAKFFSYFPEADMSACTRCMRCLKVCPSGAIDPGTLKIDRTKCLHCFACVRVCTPAARKIELKMKPLVETVLSIQTKNRKYPEIFI